MIFDSKRPLSIPQTLLLLLFLQAQSGAHYMQELLAAGVGALRVELVDLPAERVAPLLNGYRCVCGSRRGRH